MKLWRRRSRADLDLLKYSRRSMRRGVGFQALGWSSFAVTIGGVLAAAITLNTNGSVEFGQGSVRTIVCDRNVSIEPAVYYENSTQTFFAESLVLSNLNNNPASGDDQGCGNKTLIISVFDANDPAGSPIFQKLLFIGAGNSTNYREEIPLSAIDESQFETTDIGNIIIEQQTVAISGILDSSFSTDGLVETVFSSGENLIFDIALQSNGKIIGAGVDNFSLDNDFALARYLSDGSLDSSFGTSGKSALDLGSNNDDARTVGLQSTGKIVLAGYTTPGGGDFDFALARFNADGTLDTNFASSGIRIADIAGADDLIYDLVIDSSDRIIVVGRTQTGSNVDAVVARFSAAGVLDTSFGSAGYRIINSGSAGINEYARSVVLDSSGNIWIGGYKSGGSNLQPAIWKLNSDGSYASGWSAEGWTSATGDGDARIQDIVIAQDGNIAAAGDSLDDSTVQFTIWMFDTSANDLVSTFGTADVQQHSVGSGNAFAFGIDSQRDGKLVIGGQAIGTSNEDFAVIQVGLSDGALDSSFGSSGIVISAVGSNEDLINAIQVQTDGWIVAGGYADNNIDKRNFAIARFR